MLGVAKPGVRRFGGLGGFLARGAVMGTRIFDTVQTYDTPATTSINLVAKRLHSVDLAAFGAVGTVLCNFPAGTEVGEAIGLCVTAGGSAVLGAGSGSAQFPFGLQSTDECALFAWSGTTWALAAKYLDPPALPFYARTFEAADMSGGAIVITHSLGSNFPGVALYDDAGQLVQPSLGLVSQWGVTRIDSESFTLELDATLLPISGFWGVGVSYT